VGVRQTIVFPCACSARVCGFHELLGIEFILGPLVRFFFRRVPRTSAIGSLFERVWCMGVRLLMPVGSSPLGPYRRPYLTPCATGRLLRAGTGRVQVIGSAAPVAKPWTGRLRVDVLGCRFMPVTCLFTSIARQCCAGKPTCLRCHGGSFCSYFSSFLKPSALCCVRASFRLLVSDVVSLLLLLGPLFLVSAALGARRLTYAVPLTVCLCAVCMTSQIPQIKCFIDCVRDARFGTWVRGVGMDWRHGVRVQAGRNCFVCLEDDGGR